MWTKSHTILTNEVTKEQMWKLFADVNNWHTWDDGIEFAKIEGNFEKGNFFILRPKGGPNVKVKLLETIENKMFLDVTNFPLAKMYDHHVFEETSQGLKITNSITVTGILGFLWRKIVAQKIVDALPIDMKQQVQSAKRYNN
ncbi:MULTISPECIES: polyketide cyclase [unclassified Chryseobacterium]|uniref:polyketide cyclase n=1 Tax=unclassified Chryseobacterium TaxID=2593645 RepID=UPI000D38E5FE|nr:MULTISPECIES: polyketide cyclase [unclassified Chryseobacterium]PTT70928.1 polyketide cyclase [Chryseobacterium sp. HMWF001]PVV55230.1 polyketide cyclase [Chryseobacterium sp. HMWF035]